MFIIFYGLCKIHEGGKAAVKLQEFKSMLWEATGLTTE